MDDISLFPLNTVLFPGVPLNLHIFEDRYKEMMNTCLDTRQNFGVVLIRSGLESYGPIAEVHPIGCTAKIVEVERLSEGRMNIAAVGIERFRILDLNRSQDYLQGKIARYPLIETDEGPLARAATRLRPWLKQYLEVLAEVSDIQIDLRHLPAEPVSLAYLAAYLVQSPPRDKQRLLEAPSALELYARLERGYRKELAILKAELSTQQKDVRGFGLN